MAYVIGSDDGKKKAQEMKAGEKWTATDGSTWEKKNDGSVSVTTKSGEKFDNAYKPTSYYPVTQADGGTTYKRTNNSQYTKPTLGNTWDANTDYQAIINTAVANGDYVTAAKAEQLRNQKILATGSNYDRTSQYGGTLDGSGIDWGTVGTNQVKNGASWEDVLSTYYTRYGKAASTEGLEDFKNDEIQNMMWQYIVDRQQKDNQPAPFEYSAQKPKQPKRDPRIDALLEEILNRDDFSYNAENDPLYQQYADMYRREGDRAMRNTLAEAAAGAGGMNTYAITAAQQANSYYNSQLNDKIPELYQIAYEMYLNDKESKVQDLGILQNMDETQYSRYRDTVNDWYKDKDFAYGVYRDDVRDGQWRSQFDYNAMVDNRNFMSDESWKNKEWDYQVERDQIYDSRYDKEWEYQVGRDQIYDSRYDDEISYNRGQVDKETAREDVWKLIEMGVVPSAELIKKAGMSETDVNLAISAIQAEKNKKGTSSSGGGGSSGGGSNRGYTGETSQEADISDYKVTNQTFQHGILVGDEIMDYDEIKNGLENKTISSKVDTKKKTIFFSINNKK